jgi:thiamine-phosphate pyrophosphorylase
LHVLADDDPRWRLDPVAQALAACRGGASVIQLRAKHSTDRETLAWAREIRAITREHRARFVVNDRFDLALLAQADGVHLGQTDLSPDSIPESVRATLCIGRSTHDVDQARAATREAVDYIAFGPVFGTRSKDSKYDERGTEMLAAIVRLISPRPLVAIGGIGVAQLDSVMDAGAAGVAVISAVIDANDPEAATRALVERINASRSASGRAE